MSFLDLYQGDQEQAARQQPNEGTRLPSTFGENFHAAWSDGLLFSQSVARENARAGVLSDYLAEVRQKTGRDFSQEIDPNAESGSIGPGMFEQANARVAKLKESYPDLDLDPLSNEEIDRRALTKSQAAHRNYETLQAGEKTWGGSFGSFLGSAGAGAVDPINIIGLPIAPEAAGIGILSTALRWGALAGVSQAVIEFQSDDYKEQVQPGYTESGAPLHEIGGAFVGGAVVGGGIKALGNAWTRVKSGQWPTSVRDAGNVIESEANVASTNPFPGAEGEVAHREALVKTIDDILAGRPVDVGAQITPEQAAHFEAWHGSPHEFERFDMSKIGTGEGAQAFGHGLYFAESEDVGRHYYDMMVPAYKRKKLEWFPPDAVKIFQPNPAYAPGGLYKVRINADRAKMLDLDLPLREQSQFVQDALLNNPDPMVAGTAAKWGHDVHTMYDRIAQRLAENGEPGDAATSKMLSEAGIPGIKFLDKNSRATGEGSRNIVLFDDKHVEITHRNGKPVNPEIRQQAIDEAKGLPPKQPELPLAGETEPVAPKHEPGPPAPLQTAEEMNKTLTAPDHQDAIRADIDRERALGDFKVPGVDENGNHTMVGIDAEMEKVDAYKQAAEQIQACANPAQEAAE